MKEQLSVWGTCPKLECERVNGGSKRLGGPNEILENSVHALWLNSWNDIGNLCDKVKFLKIYF